ncbi:MAG: ATP-binding protein [Deltaproteobacteria bacterium]|jgi:hypothetical protein|nr:ATP-binding protein [Deltaproteobacteria bacterium]
MIPALVRNPDIMPLIDEKRFFVIHSPRQSGKTTLLNALCEEINGGGKYYALKVSVSAVEAAETKHEAFDIISGAIQDAVKISSLPAMESLAVDFPLFPEMDIGRRKKNILQYMCARLDKDLVVFFDEADVIPETSMIAFLRQIREGYLSRKEDKAKFPRSLAFVGLLDLRDYRLTDRPNGQPRRPGSPFNVKRASLSIPNFSENDIRSLYSQHTDACGQKFDESAIERAWYWTDGQPWLVNALASDIVKIQLRNQFSEIVTGTHVDTAANKLIFSREHHFDSLLERLKDHKVRRVMSAVIAGSQLTSSMIVDDPVNTIFDDDIQLCVDVGLLKYDPDGPAGYLPANRIYNEIFLRTLVSRMNLNIPEKFVSKWYRENAIDMNGLMKAFQRFWMKNAELLTDKAKIDVEFGDSISRYLEREGLAFAEMGSENKFIVNLKRSLVRIVDESSCVLVLYAFLQRVLNGGTATVNRHYPLGRKAVDLFVEYEGHAYPIEVKIKGHMTSAKSIRQLQGYIDRCRASEGWLVVFDRGTKKPIKDKISSNTVKSGKDTVYVVNC